MKIKWEVYDGYVGKARPHYTEINEEDLEGLTEEEKEDMIRDIIQEDFNQTIDWHEVSREE